MGVNIQNAKAFGADLEKFAATIGVSVELVVKRTVFQLHRRITELTPVRTGRARASWGISYGSVPNDPGEPPSIGKVPISKQRSRVNPGDFAGAYGVWWIYNNLPYIQRLEEGYSRQAPAGMVAVALAEVEAEILFDLSLEGIT